MGYNGFKDDSSYNPKYGINGRVQKDEFSIDGKSWNYRDPSNTQYSDGHIADRIGDDGSAEDYGNRNSYDYTNDLYHYSYGQARDAAKAKGITNVNSKEDVDSLIDYMQNGPEKDTSLDDRYATADQLNSLQDSIQQRSEQAGPTEISSTLTNAQSGVDNYDQDKGRQGANIFGAIAPANDLELAREEVQANEASGDGLDYTDKYKLNVKGGLQLSGTKTRGPDSGLMRDGSGFGWLIQKKN